MTEPVVTGQITEWRQSRLWALSDTVTGAAAENAAVLVKEVAGAEDLNGRYSAHPPQWLIAHHDGE
jgi:hypothetical protein